MTKPSSTRELILGVFLACLLVTLSLFGRATASNELAALAISTDTREGRLAVFDNVWETIDERYYDPNFGGIDWKAARGFYRQSAADARGSRELYEILRRMISVLDDPHTRVYSPEEKFDWWSPRFVSTGLAIRDIDGVPTVIYVEPKSAPAKAGLRPGDQIESVDGVAAASLVQKRMQRGLQFDESRSARYHAVATILEGEAGSAAKIAWRGKDGKVKSAEFPRYWTERQLGFRIIREHSYLVIEIEGFTQSLVLELVRALRDKLKDVKAIILDLRRNGGGDADAMAEIAAVFLGEGVNLGRFTDRAGASIQLMTHAKTVLTATATKETKLPLVLLVGERTSSAAEILAAALQTAGRANVVGTETCGCVLAIRSRHSLPDNGVLDVSEFDYRTAGDVRLEGRGVRPDTAIALLRSDLYAKRDRARQKAFEILNNQTRTPR